MNNPADLNSLELNVDRIYSFRSAALSGMSSYRIGEKSVQQLNEDGSIQAELDLSEISQLYYSSREVRSIRYANLDIVGESGLIIRLSCNTPLRSWGFESDSISFCDMIENLMKVLHDERPDLYVTLSDAKAWRVAWFILALLIVILGFGIPGLAIVEGVELNRILVITPILGLMGLFGLNLAWNSRPWKAPVRLTVAQFFNQMNRLVRSNRL